MAADEGDALLPPLPDDAQLATADVQVSQPGCGQLTDAEPRGVRGLDQGEVPQREGTAVAGQIRFVDEPLHFRHGQNLRQASREARRDRRGPWIAADDALAPRVTVERAQCRHAAADRTA